MSARAVPGMAGRGTAGPDPGSRSRNLRTLWILAAVAGSLGIFTIFYVAYYGL